MFELPANFKDYFTYESMDIIDRPYTELFSENDEIVIQLRTNEAFHGVFLEAGKNRIDIIHVKQLDTSNELNGVYSLYRNEIETIFHMPQKIEVQPVVQELKSIKLDKDEYFRLKGMITNYVYIEESCSLVKAYSDALEALRNVEQIGVSTPGILGRVPSIPLLVLSTWKDIFIFDTSKLVPPNFFPDMRQIFESENICKIIHRGGPLLDILHTYYSIEAKYVFDTDVVDIMIQSRKSPDRQIESRNVFQCLEAYLNFPSSLNEQFKVKPHKWKKRPLKESKKVYASQLVVYLITLKETLSDILFNDFHKTVDNFCNYYSNITSAFDYSVKFNISELTPDLQELITDMSLLSN